MRIFVTENHLLCPCGRVIPFPDKGARTADITELSCDSCGQKYPVSFEESRGVPFIWCTEEKILE